MPREQQEYYEEIAEKERREHKEKHPNYTYRPVKNKAGKDGGAATDAKGKGKGGDDDEYVEPKKTKRSYTRRKKTSRQVQDPSSSSSMQGVIENLGACLIYRLESYLTQKRSVSSSGNGDSANDLPPSTER